MPALIALAVVLLSVTVSLAWSHTSAPALEHAPQPPRTAEAPTVRPFVDLHALLVNPYIARPTGQRADPVNIIFLGSNDVEAVSRVLSEAFGWRDGGGGNMLFAQRGEPAVQDRQLTSQMENGRRFHIRLKAGQDTIHGWPYILAAIHADYNSACGHVGREFNTARDFLMVELVKRGFSLRTESWGNTEPARHCDGSDTAGDGTIAVFTLPTPAYEQW